MNKDKKYVFEIIVRETENLKKICSTITACDYTFEELKGRKADHEILNCKDILLDHLPKKELEKYFKDSKNHSDLKKSDTCNAPKNSIFGEEYRKKIAEVYFDYNLGSFRLKDTNGKSYPITTYRFDESGNPIGLINVFDEVIGTVFDNE